MKSLNRSSRRQLLGGLLGGLCGGLLAGKSSQCDSDASQLTAGGPGHSASAIPTVPVISTYTYDQLGRLISCREEWQAPAVNAPRITWTSYVIDRGPVEAVTESRPENT